MKLDVAIAITANAFIGEYDKSGEPYILHCLQVMNNLKKWGDEELLIIGVLHDIVEDTNWGIIDLSEHDASERVLNAVALLTHDPSDSYDEYIDAICLNKDAIKVKMADLEHNSSILRLKGVKEKDLQRIAKYHRAYIKLKECLDVGQGI